MEDSSLFMQWALSILQHEHPPATPDGPGPAPRDGGDHSLSPLPELGLAVSGLSASMSSMVPGEPPAREGSRATGSWSSGETTHSGGESVTALERDGWSPSQNSAVHAAPRSSGANQPVSWNFSAASARPSKEAMRNSTATDGGGGGGAPLMVQESLPTRRTTARRSGSTPSSAMYVQHHILAERRRRERIDQRFIELSTVIPGLKKMDKATILSDATRYVKELQGKIKEHEDSRSNGHQNVEYGAVLAKNKKPRITVPDDEDGAYVASVPAATSGALPEIAARISEEM